MRRTVVVLLLLGLTGGAAWFLIPPSTESLLRDVFIGSGTDRIARVDQLDRRADERVVPTLIELLKDDNSVVAVHAALCLARRGDSATADLVLDALDRDEVYTQWYPGPIDDSEYNSGFAKAAGIHPEVRFRLLKRLVSKDYGDEGDARRMLRALAFGGREAVEPLLSVFMEKSAKIDAIACQAAYSLINLGATECYAVLVERIRPWLLDWSNGNTAADLLKRMDWTPSSAAESVHFAVAARDGASLTGNWEATRTVLISDLASGDRAMIENALYAFIGIGNPVILQDLLTVLESEGSGALAEAYLNCGRIELVDAAKRWATDHDFSIRTGPGNAPVGWGQFR